MPTPTSATAGGGSNAPNFPPRHPKYYIDGGDFHIVAGGMLFRVHSYFFTRESTAFLHPSSPTTKREGSTDQDPVILPSPVTAQDFETFLGVFYNPRYSVYDNSVEQWTTVLRFAHQWEFKEVKELAVRELNKKPDSELSLVDRLALYHMHQVDPHHLVPLYAELCSKDIPLTLAEATILGLQTTVFIAAAREMLRASPSNEGRNPIRPGMEMDDIFRALEVQLNLPLGSTTAFHQLSPLSPITDTNLGRNNRQPTGSGNTPRGKHPVGGRGGRNQS